MPADCKWKLPPLASIVEAVIPCCQPHPRTWTVAGLGDPFLARGHYLARVIIVLPHETCTLLERGSPMVGSPPTGTGFTRVGTRTFPGRYHPLECRSMIQEWPVLGLCGSPHPTQPSLAPSVISPGLSHIYTKSYPKPAARRGHPEASGGWGCSVEGNGSSGLPEASTLVSREMWLNG